MQHSECPSSAQGDMEQALENYDICTEMLQSSAAARAAAGAEQRDVVIDPISLTYNYKTR